ncbi:MAG: RNA polymerase sigma factor [Akkermansiaceae bacterium]
MDYQAATDEELAQRCISELPDTHLAFDQIIHRYTEYVLKLTYRVLWNHSDADEATQEVFIRLFNKIHLFKGKSSFKTWFYRFTLNIAIRLQQKRSKYEKRVTEYVHETEITKDSTSPNTVTDTLAQVRKLLNELPKPDQEIIMLKFYSELSFVDIAKVLDIGESAIKMRYYRAIKSLSQRYSQKNPNSLE